VKRRWRRWKQSGIESRRPRFDEIVVLTTKFTKDTKFTKVPLALTVLVSATIATHAQQAREASQSPAAFEVASVKRSAPDARGSLISGPAPSGFRTLNAPLSNIIVYAYGIADYQLVGGPAWARSERFDITARYPDGDDRSRVPEMVQALLAERFALKAHKEVRDGQMFSLEIDQLTSSLSRLVGRRVENRTELSGNYDFDLEWTPEAARKPLSNPGADQPSLDDNLSIYTAIREQLGLELKSTTGPVEVIVIDSVSAPAPD
jgi:hypothetical protein